MPGISEGLPAILRALAANAALSSEVRSRLRDWGEREELPSIPALAEVLEHWGAGFSYLELLSFMPRWFPQGRPPPGDLSPRIFVARLDVGLRSLRVSRRWTQTTVAEAAGFKPSQLSMWERPETGERPSIEELDRVLRALNAGYGELEKAIRNPFRNIPALERRVRREAAVTVKGELAPEVVAERFDLALRVLRSRRGWARGRLAEESGLSVSRITALETRGQGEPPHEEEVSSLLRGLNASPADLEEAARLPLRELERLERDLRKVERDRAAKGPTEIGEAPATAVVTERFDLALQVLRADRGLSRKALAEEAGLAPNRLTALETWRPTEPATPEEVESLRRALGADLKDFDKAARWPLRGLARLRQRMTKLGHELEAREQELEAALTELEELRRVQGHTAGPAFGAAARLGNSVERLRDSLAETS